MKTNNRQNNLWLALLFTLATAALVAMATGCKSTSASYDSKSGNWKVSDRRLLLKTEAEITATIAPDGRREVTIKAKSDPNAEAFKAIAEGAAAGAVKFLKP